MLIYDHIINSHHRILTTPLLNIFCLTVALFVMTSCEKVVTLQLNDSTPKVVIQGTIFDQSGPFYVKISKSVNFDDSNSYPPITGAKVEITDNQNQTEILTETAAGTYKTSRLRGIPGRKYSLTVNTGNESYVSAATMPAPVSIDSLAFASSPFTGDKFTLVCFNDPPFAVNYYRMVYFVNNVQQKEIYILEDEIFQGASIKYSLISRGSGLKLVKGDNVTVWLESIDKSVYDYFRTTGHENGQSTSPSNPVSNISNGALGYFSACSVRKISSIVSK